jgi:trk system potassium uptake protein TrkA
MKIIVIGCGKIGTTVIKSLISEGHNVVAVDDCSEVITQVTNIYDAMAVCGSGADCDVLEEAGAADADLVIAVTGSDELNMLCCFLAKRMGTKHTVARIRNPEHNDRSLAFLREHLDISLVINPERLAAKEIFNVLKLPNADKVEMFSSHKLEMVEFKLKPDSVLDGLTLIEIRKKFPIKFLVCAVSRGDDVFIPSGNFVLKSGDRIAVTASPAEVLKLFKKTDESKRPAKDVMILGASRIAHYLSQMLISSGSSVKVVELDRARCEAFCDHIPEAVVINGDGAQQELLAEEGISNMDAFVALTGNDEQNILISFFASSQSVGKVVSKVNREEFYSIAEKLGLDTIISVKKSVTDIIVRYARSLENSIGSKIETLYSFMDSKAEAAEFIVSDDFEFSNIPLKDMKLKPNTLIAGIIRKRQAIIPSGDDVILSGDKVIVLTAGRNLNDLSEIVK